MARKKSYPQPTNGELEILNVLWDRGPSTVREVHDVLSGIRETRYTTVLKLMQIMSDKGLVERDESEKAHIYRAAPNARSTRTTLLNDLLARAFGGSAQKLIVHALSEMRATPEELAEIRTLIEKMEDTK